MGNQPHVYTLPEGFIEDPSVPLHWKLYTVINGFWIAGKPVFASNPWFAEKLKCSDRHIRRCLEKLESMGYIDREIDGHQRTIYPGGRTSDVRGGGHGRSGQADMGGPPIAVSISVSKRSETKVSHILEEQEEDSDKKRVTTIRKEKKFLIDRIFNLFPPNRFPGRKFWSYYKGQGPAALEGIKVLGSPERYRKWLLQAWSDEENLKTPVYISSPLEFLNKLPALKRQFKDL